MSERRLVLGPLIERIERRLLLLEASERLETITVDEMTDALLDVRLGCPGTDAEDQRRSTRYYAERLLTRLSVGHRGVDAIVDSAVGAPAEQAPEAQK